TASALGPYGLSLLTLRAALAAGAALGPAPIGRAAPPVLAAALVAGAWGWGAARLADAAPPPDDAPLVRILQTAVPQAIKWEPDRQAENFAMLLDLTAPPGATPPAVAIWPETAVTFVLDESPEALAILGDRLRGVPAAIGSLRRDGRGETARWRNSLFLFDGVGGLGAPFDKIHLVPFGEYTPLYGLMEAIGLSAFAGPGVAPGEAPVLMTPAGAPAFAPLICYEMIFPRETARAAEGAEWMALVTNDAWFGGWAGPLQHFAKARLRAIETGLPIARSANMGVSAMIDPYGRPQSSLSMGEAVAVDARLPDSLKETPYRLYGELLCALAVCIIIPLATVGRRSARR
ncbi:MAG: apolipoprotein N-acyltransferase, partial [Pseudomonadota bacterium]